MVVAGRAVLTVVCFPGVTKSYRLRTFVTTSAGRLISRRCSIPEDGFGQKPRSWPDYLAADSVEMQRRCKDARATVVSDCDAASPFPCVVLTCNVRPTPVYPFARGQQN